jgi:nucleoside-diphosphate-sugar epimerase
MNIFIAGGAGFIGSHCGRLLAEGAERVTVYDNLTSGRRASSVMSRKYDCVKTWFWHGRDYACRHCDRGHL